MGPWAVIVPYVGLAVAWVFLPGLVVVVAARLRGFAAVALAAPVSACLLGGTAVVASLIKVPWGPLPVVVTTAVTAVLAWLLQRGRTHAEIAPPGPGARARLGAVWQAWFARDARWWAGLIVAALLMTRQWVAQVGGPDAFSQANDEIYHLNGVRWILDHADGSSFTLNYMVNPAGGFYPAAWHDTVSVVAALGFGSPSVSGDAIVYATNSLMVVMVALVWPMGVLAVLSAVAGRGASPLAVVLVAAALSMTADYPYFLARQMYPDLMSVALMPAMLALAARLWRVDAAPDEPSVAPGSWFVLVLGAGGLALAQPNAVLAFLGMTVVPMGVQRCVHVTRQRPGAGRVAVAWTGFAGSVAITVGAWIVLRTRGVSTAPWFDPVTALGRLATAADLRGVSFWALSVCFLAGLIVVLTHPKQAWLIGSFAWAAIFWMIAAAGTAPWHVWLLAGFYGSPSRVVPYLVLAQLVLAGVALSFVVSALRRFVSRVSFFRRRWLQVTATAALLVMAVLLGQPMSDSGPSLPGASADYRIPASGGLVDAAEYTLIERLPSLVEPDKMIAVDPWKGGSLVYALAGLPVTAPYLDYTPAPDVAIVEKSLNTASANPAVCRAVRRLNLGYVLDFGNTHQVKWLKRDLPGYAGLAHATGFVPIAREGPAVLYRIDACGTTSG